MKKNLSAILILFALVANSQTPAWKWGRTAGGTGHDGGAEIGSDNNGNCYVTGTYQAPSARFGTFSLSTSGSSQVFLTKYDSSGTALWAIGAQGTASSAEDLVTDINGNSHLVGTFNGSVITLGSMTATSSIGGIFIAKIDASGNTVFIKHADYKPTALNGHLGIGVDGSGNSYVTGNATSIMPNVDSLMLSKYDNLGNLVWKKYAKGTNWNTYSIATDNSGNSYIAGRIVSGTLDAGGAVITNTLNGAIIFIAKYDASGSLVWARAAGNYPTLYEPSIAIDAAGNSYVAGYYLGNYTGFGNITLTNTNQVNAMNEIYFVKFDPAGNVVWAKNAGGMLVDGVKDLAVDPQGNILLTGYFQDATSFDNIFLSGAGSSDIFVAKYSSAGNALWAKNVGGPKVETAGGITVNNSGKIYVTGGYKSNRCIFDSDTIINTDTISNSGEIYIAKIGAASTSTMTGITNYMDREMGFLVAPNPFSESATITLSEILKNGEISIYNSLGGLVRKEENLFCSQITIKRNELPPGIYFLLLQNDQQILSRIKITIAD
jgi:hypothetical protein